MPCSHVNGKHKVSHRIAKRAYNRKMRAAILAFLGGKCQRCGFSDARALQVDHVHGDAKNARKSDGADTVLWGNIINGTATFDYQLLCANCNWIKRCERKEWGNRLTP